jgi:predicted AAA+ superfamily ATPase
MQIIREVHQRVLRLYNKKYFRYLHRKVNWDSGAICIFGARGTGKTTMIVQHIAQKYGNSDEALYIAGDHPEVLTTGLYEIADQHF